MQDNLARKQSASANPAVSYARSKIRSTPLKSTSSSIRADHDDDQRQLKDLTRDALRDATHEENDFIARWFPKMQSRSNEELLSKLQESLTRQSWFPVPPARLLETFEVMAH